MLSPVEVVASAGTPWSSPDCTKEGGGGGNGSVVHKKGSNDE